MTFLFSFSSSKPSLMVSISHQILGTCEGFSYKEFSCKEFSSSKLFVPEIYELFLFLPRTETPPINLLWGPASSLTHTLRHGQCGQKWLLNKSRPGGERKWFTTADTEKVSRNECFCFLPKLISFFLSTKMQSLLRKKCPLQPDGKFCSFRYSNRQNLCSEDAPINKFWVS